MTVEDVLASSPIAPNTSVLECARRADGGAAILLASAQYLEQNGLSSLPSVVVISGGEGYVN